MPASAQPPLTTSVESTTRSMSPAPLSFDALVEETFQPQGGEQVSSARKAVDSAMAIVEELSKGGQRRVNLQFSFSGVDVAVRVEMRDDDVHTTFRTDSPELRAALAQEWQSVISTQTADRSQKLADPVFTSTSGQGSTSGDSGASQQRESNARQSPWENLSAFASRMSAPASAVATSVESLRARSSRPETTRHLDAVA